MATKRPPKTRRTLLQEASDPATDPARLRELAETENDDAVCRAALRNPSVPEDLWRTFFVDGWPEAWDNPMTPFYLIAWTSRSEEENEISNSARWATEALWENPKRCSPEGKALMDAKFQEWWVTSTNGMLMSVSIGLWAWAKGKDSPEHRKAVRIFVDCVRTIPSLEDEDCQALDFLQDWSEGGEDLRMKANDLNCLKAVSGTVRFAADPSFDAWHIFHELRIHTYSQNYVSARRQEAEDEHDRQMADVIRRKMPLPPGVA